MSLFGCRTTGDASGVKASQDVGSAQNLGGGLLKVQCSFGRAEVTTVTLMNAEKVCDQSATNYMADGSPVGGGVFNITCASGAKRVATIAQVNAGLCGPAVFTCSCLVTDSSSILGFSQAVTGIQASAGALAEAEQKVTDDLCFQGVLQINPAFSRGSADISQVRCAQNP